MKLFSSSTPGWLRTRGPLSRSPGLRGERARRERSSYSPRSRRKPGCRRVDEKRVRNSAYGAGLRFRGCLLRVRFRGCLLPVRSAGGVWVCALASVGCVCAPAGVVCCCGAMGTVRVPVAAVCAPTFVAARTAPAVRTIKLTMQRCGHCLEFVFTLSSVSREMFLVGLFIGSLAEPFVRFIVQPSTPRLGGRLSIFSLASLSPGSRHGSFGRRLPHPYPPHPPPSDPAVRV